MSCGVTNIAVVIIVIVIVLIIIIIIIIIIIMIYFQGLIFPIRSILSYSCKPVIVKLLLRRVHLFPFRAAGEDIVLPVQSARIRTINSFSFLHGRLEVRAKMPRGDWIWPAAIWMKPRYNEYGPWPSSGEIDIIEVRSNKKLTNSAGVSQGIDKMGATLHFGLNSSYNIWRPTHWELSIEETGRDFSDDFHIFGLEWTADYINFTVDGKTIGSRGVPPGGFWHLGGFDKIPGATNIWADGEPMAPFDKEVIKISTYLDNTTFPIFTL
ncbi:hypothetical protein ANN_21320, partial [Periplaneta americana]